MQMAQHMDDRSSPDKDFNSGYCMVAGIPDHHAFLNSYWYAGTTDYNHRG